MRPYATSVFVLTRFLRTTCRYSVQLLCILCAVLANSLSFARACLLYWYKSTNTDLLYWYKNKHTDAAPPQAAVHRVFQSGLLHGRVVQAASWAEELGSRDWLGRYSVYLLCWYKSTITDAAHPQMPYLGILPRVCVGEEMGTWSDASSWGQPSTAVILYQ